MNTITTRTECCKQCPFARTTSKEYLDTMGQNGERFAGQANGPFFLPCHMESGFRKWADNPAGAPQCAGAAKYRANTGRDAVMPGSFPKLPPDHEHVFSNPAELLAHHHGVSLREAREYLEHFPPELLTQIALAESKTRIIALKKGNQ